ncbi:hypothetical protein D9758_013963 [Tetrapyrgos nigripes]|uniref:CCHC-type domain-containing protein n=1 Tax=Tetrapyrgos nigripes TaxID=182062 RepID=A0A8H5LK15_9AGAR|nr:hypothetical protein D9758_013963 [Tetrapyrgos nigripes]
MHLLWLGASSSKTHKDAQRRMKMHKDAQRLTRLTKKMQNSRCRTLLVTRNIYPYKHSSSAPPDPPSNNPSTPHRNPSPDPSDPNNPSSPTIPSTEGPSVAPRCPAPTPSPEPSDPDDPAMSDVAPNDANNTSERGRKPDAFNGECDKAKRWLASFNNYLCQNKARYATEDSRVSLFLSFFTGERGGDWATQQITEREEDEEDVKDFKALASDEVAKNKIKNARMKGTDISSYNSIFDTYGEESDFGETALLDYYKEGLPEKLWKTVGMTWPKWKDFDEYRERTMDLHLEWMNERAREEWSRLFSTPRTSAGPSQGRTVASMNALMNMGSDANSSFTPLPKLAPEERDRLRKLGACFTCRQPGHMSNECPTFSNNTPRSSMAQNTSRNFPPCAVRTAKTSASSSSSSSPLVTVAQTSSLSSSRNVIKDISDMVNKVKGLEGEEKEQAAVYLKDIMSKLDF